MVRIVAGDAIHPDFESLRVDLEEGGAQGIDGCRAIFHCLGFQFHGSAICRNELDGTKFIGIACIGWFSVAYYESEALRSLEHQWALDLRGVCQDLDLGVLSGQMRGTNGNKAECKDENQSFHGFNIRRMEEKFKFEVLGRGKWVKMAGEWEAKSENMSESSAHWRGDWFRHPCIGKICRYVE
jgi:hypothetical protein